MKSTANFSSCRTYRYSLTRIWDDSKPIYLFIGLNPSIADEVENDKTMERITNFVKEWGGGGFYMANLFAYVATDPDDMKGASEPIGDENDNYIKKLAKSVDKIVLCWGNHGVHLNRSAEVKKLLSQYDLYCLDQNQTGEPKHPLYISGDQKLQKI